MDRLFLFYHYRFYCTFNTVTKREKNILRLQTMLHICGRVNSDQPEHSPSLVRVIAIRMEKGCVLSLLRSECSGTGVKQLISCSTQLSMTLTRVINLNNYKLDK